MGIIKKEGSDIVFQQDDGQITARFIDYEEKMELSHEGHPSYQKFLKFWFCAVYFT